jgi:PEP-CTERM motif
VTADPFLDSFYSFGYQFPTSSGNLQIDGIDTDADIIFTATVPEPSTWAMMLLGFAGLGLPAIAGRESHARRKGAKKAPHERGSTAVIFDPKP